jgi:transcriptional regulator of acetoin/glycerol metabolism
VVVGKSRSIMPADLPIFRPEHLSVPPDKSIQNIEMVHITHILNENRWNISRSAEILGIDRSTLYSKIKRYKINKPA